MMHHVFFKDSVTIFVELFQLDSLTHLFHQIKSTEIKKVCNNTAVMGTKECFHQFKPSKHDSLLFRNSLLIIPSCAEQQSINLAAAVFANTEDLPCAYLKSISMASVRPTQGGTDLRVEAPQHFGEFI